MENTRLLDFFRCPVNHDSLSDEGRIIVSNSGLTYQKVHGQPVLVDFDNSVLDRNRVLGSQGGSPIKGRSGTGVKAAVKKYALHAGADQRAEKNAGTFLEEVGKHQKNPTI